MAALANFSRPPLLRQLLAAVLAVLIGSILMKLGNALLSLTISLSLNEAGVGKEQIGVVAAIFSAGYLVGGLYANRLIRTIGHVRAIAGTTALAAIVTLLLPLYLDSVYWALLRGVYGFTVAVGYIVFESWLNERATNETRGRVLGLYATSNYLALSLGQLLINVTPLGDSLAFSLCAMLILAGLIPVVSTRLPQPALSDVERLSPWALYRHSPLAVVAVMGSGLLSGGLFGLNAVFAQEIGLSLFQVSLFTGANVFGGFLLLWFIGRLSDRLGRRFALGCGLAGVAATSLVILSGALWSLPFALLLAASLLLGGHLSSLYHMAVAHAYDRLPRQHYVAASGSFQLYYSAGSIVGPIVVGGLMEVFGSYALWGYLAAVAGVILAFLIYRSLVRPVVQSPGAAEVPPPQPGQA